MVPDNLLRTAIDGAGGRVPEAGSLAILGNALILIPERMRAMPYKRREDLPDSIRRALRKVPHAQDIYKETFNSALKQYGEEDRAHAVAWHAVKKRYAKGEDGSWRLKAQT